MWYQYYVCCPLFFVILPVGRSTVMSKLIAFGSCCMWILWKILTWRGLTFSKFTHFILSCPSVAQLQNFNCFERPDAMEWNGTLPNSHTCHMQAHINCISSSYLYEEYECTYQLTCCYVKVKVQLIHHQKNKSASDSNWALCVFHFEFIGKYSCSVL